MPVMPLMPASYPASCPAICLGLLRDQLALKLLEASLAGARELMLFWCGVTATSRKHDGSVVSEADHAADAAVRTALGRIGLDAVLVSEESAHHSAEGRDTFLLLDPLDGTHDFLEHGPEFCVCLAAIHHGRAVAGAIVAPALKRAWFAGEHCFAVSLDNALIVEGQAEALHVESRPRAADNKAIISRRNGDPRTDAALKDCGVSSMMMVSSAIKFGMLAEGRADILVRHGRTMAWDIAAGDAVLSAAGGTVCGFDGEPLLYDGSRPDFDNPPFIAVARADMVRPVLDAVQRAS